ncbi:MAG TPA: TMEM175 family protein [Ktedonobacterales bacterium]|nr:TMEM175 family protein [Ktedonobacterales bacterium]
MDAPETMALLAQDHDDDASETGDHERRPQVVGGLNDTVFGLSITLLATAITIRPESPTHELVAQLGALAYSFFVIAHIWLRRYQLVQRMRVEPVGFLRLNFLLLFLVISYTYILRLFALSSLTANGKSSGPSTSALFLFALLTALINITVAAEYEYALRRNIVAEADRPFVAQARLSILLGALVFAISIPFVLIHFQIAIAIWLCSVPAGLTLRRVMRRRKQPRAKAGTAV